MSTIRDMLHQRERETLSEYAVFSEDSRGRDFPVSPDDLRTDFQRDRDRIIHSKAFRRLMHKTQVFLSPEADHYRTRLTHTLEVTQIARTIARSLRLNEDLCEAIGLGHDLGHTPFGHAGERVLQRCYDENFAHYKQSLRVVEKLENLNLTWEVRDGIVTHTGEEVASTLEGRIIKFADRIAYINHDIDDACRAGIMQDDDIPLDLRRKLGASHGARIDTMVRSIIRASQDKPEIIMEDDVYKATMSLREFLFETVYKSPIAKGQEGKAECMLEQLYTYFLEHTEALPGEYKWMLRDEEPGRIVCDYISGMTDRYAINLYRSLFIPEVWSGGVLR